MTMKEFYEKYNLNKYNFAEIAGVGTRTLIKYAEGKPIRKESKDRIEKAIHIAEKYDLVRPRFDYGYAFDRMYKSKHLSEVRKYMKRFKEIISKEG